MPHSGMTERAESWRAAPERKNENRPPSVVFRMKERFCCALNFPCRPAQKLRPFQPQSLTGW